MEYNKKRFSAFCVQKFGVTVTEWKDCARHEGLTWDEINSRLDSMRLDFMDRQNNGAGEETT